jgi:L-fucose mutarotase/ribose pyranase (RbsD/FucU family)
VIQHGLKHPGILQVLGTVGHGDQIAVVDCNYPTHLRRGIHVPLISLNVTHGVLDAPTLIRLIGTSVPIERLTYPQPSDEVAAGVVRPVHAALLKVRQETFPDAAVDVLSPLEFYTQTSDPHLALMIASGEANHFGGGILTVGYLPEIPNVLSGC